MGQINAKLRRGEGAYLHWCPGCEMLHALPIGRGWTFGRDLSLPTVRPSVRQMLGDRGVCHYCLTAGVLNFCADSWHGLRARSVPLPDLPEGFHDFMDPVPAA